MSLEHMPLAKQVDLVFREIKEELNELSSGMVFIQIRNNVIGKFGIRHFPLESKDGKVQTDASGLSEDHQLSFRQLAIEALRHKINWTHGEIVYEFALKQNTVCASVQFESNYNMANLVVKREQRRDFRETY